MLRKLNEAESRVVYSLYTRGLSMSKIARVLAKKYPGITAANVRTAINGYLERKRLSSSTPRRSTSGTPIRDGNRMKRMRFCEHMISNNEQFSNVVFVDETTIYIDPVSSELKRKGDDPSAIQAPQPGMSVHVWGGISCEGAVPVQILDGNVPMAAPMYCQIIRQYYLPFAEIIFDSRCRLAHKRTPIHSSRVVKEMIKDWNIENFEWPPESADLDPMEYVWRDMMEFLRNECKPRNVVELSKGIRKFWNDKVTHIQCRAYVSHIRTAMRKVISANGECVLDL
ncbi:hypothetical protein Y032_0093g2648 [Ancylostoma ceylanicum]|uniref:Tc1-like transposase DDE domain-containing protein n=1 Tax=Ancylostoma ceylanicum TaxID=53326 RepID=A0A016TLK3_9BILA|nr:hypothetical protein Y032_0093g2648 [Ancylostoma ceylanicum]